MSLKKVFIRADSSSLIGTGHIYRDLVLASFFKDAELTFLTQTLEGNINQNIKDAGYKIISLESNSLKELNATLNEHTPDLLIIDSYEIDYRIEKKIKKRNPKLKLMVLDDTYERHYCDTLLNHNIYAQKSKYKGLVPKSCKLLCGAEFTLLRQEFFDAKKRTYKKAKKFTVFLAMGGADTSELNILLLKALKNFKNIKVHLVTTEANKNLKKLKKFCAKKEWIRLHINSKKIAKLMAKSHLGIVTPSVVLNELHFMELPFFVLQTAPNQKEMIRYLKGSLL